MTEWQTIEAWWLRLFPRKEPTDQEIEDMSRFIARWHGSQFVDRVDGQTRTVACRDGYGSWGYSPDKYAAARWREYKGAARAIVEINGGRSLLPLDPPQ